MVELENKIITFFILVRDAEFVTNSTLKLYTQTLLLLVLEFLFAVVVNEHVLRVHKAQSKLAIQVLEANLAVSIFYFGLLVAKLTLKVC